LAGIEGRTLSIEKEGSGKLNGRWSLLQVSLFREIWLAKKNASEDAFYSGGVDGTTVQTPEKRYKSTT